MSESLGPNPEETDIIQPEVSETIVEGADLEEQPLEHSEEEPNDMQEDTEHNVPDDAIDPETEARIQALRDRGRVGVLTEDDPKFPAVEASRIDNSEHDPEAIAAVNKANRATERRDEDGKIERPVQMSRNFNEARDDRIRAIDQSEDELKLFGEDPEAWEEKMRKGYAEYESDDKRIERNIEFSRVRNQRELETIDKKFQEDIDRANKRLIESVKKRGRKQDAFRGDLLQLYARDPEKYKSMSTEEFVDQGKTYRQESWSVSAEARRELWGGALAEQLPKLVDEATDVGAFADTLNDFVNRLRWSEDFSTEDMVDFVTAIEGHEKLSIDTIPEDKDAPGRSEAIKAFQLSEQARDDAKRRLPDAVMHGYFRVGDFVPDLDRSPREQMKEAVERAIKVTDKWVEAGNKARADFEEKWGKAPEKEEPEAA